MTNMIATKDKWFEQVLHCCENIQDCNDHLATAKNPLYTMVGVMDWVTELHSLLADGCVKSKSKGAQQ